MTTETTLEVAGLKQALKTLQDMDKVARRAITQDYKQLVQPMVSDARSLVPTNAPMSGFNRSWSPRGGEPILPFAGNTGGRAPRKPSRYEYNFPGGRRQMGKWEDWQRGLNAFVSGKKPRQFGDYTKNLAVFGVQWQGHAAVLYDQSRRASTPQGARMISVLQSRFGPASRVIWKAYSSADTEIQNELERLIQRIMKQATRAIETNKELGIS